jgi:hypothetical protein
MGIKIFSSHPPELKSGENYKVFEWKEKNDFLLSTFCSLQ